MIWAILLLLLAVAFLVLEVFIPSGGALSLMTAGTLLASIVLAFRQGPIAGLTMMAIALVLLPGAAALAFAVWPHTPLGRRYLLSVPTADEVAPDSPELAALRALVGRTGRAQSPMLPSGAVEIDGRSVSALSEGVPIEPGTPVRVVEVRGSRVFVRPLDDSATGPDQAADLARPVDEVVIDPFGENSA